jgi:uncharacterized protein (TIGR03437 family)
VRDLQVNFMLPPDTAVGAAQLVVTNAAGASAPIPVTVSTVAPGIFSGGILRNGEYLEIYATGLGSVHPSATQPGLFETDLPVRVFVGAGEATEVPFAGLAPGFTGLYQVNAKIPAGTQPLYIEIGGKRSNVVNTP